MREIGARKLEISNFTPPKGHIGTLLSSDISVQVLQEHQEQNHVPHPPKVFITLGLGLIEKIAFAYAPFVNPLSNPKEA